MNNLHQFISREPFCMASGFPVKDLQDNGDGTYQGRYDLDNMSSSDKIRALQYIKLEKLAKENLYHPV